MIHNDGKQNCSHVFVDEMKSMLSKSNWNHQKTDISIHGPMTLDVHSNFKLKDGEVFLKSRKNVLKKYQSKLEHNGGLL